MNKEDMLYQLLINLCRLGWDETKYFIQKVIELQKIGLIILVNFDEYFSKLKKRIGNN